MTTAVVIGGGLAGITAALALAQAKHEVTLLEAKPRLGGATMSFNRGGLVVDTGQHVFLHRLPRPARPPRRGGPGPAATALRGDRGRARCWENTAEAGRTAAASPSRA